MNASKSLLNVSKSTSRVTLGLTRNLCGDFLHEEPVRDLYDIFTEGSQGKRSLFWCPECDEKIFIDSDRHAVCPYCDWEQAENFDYVDDDL